MRRQKNILSILLAICVIGFSVAGNFLIASIEAYQLHKSYIHEVDKQITPIINLSSKISGSLKYFPVHLSKPSVNLSPGNRALKAKNSIFLGLAINKLVIYGYVLINAP